MVGSRLHMCLAFFLFRVLISDSILAQKYTNPITPPLSIADPFVLEAGNNYYLYGTSAGDGFKVWKSDDLVDWDSLGYAYRRSEDSWGQGSFWAPEVIRYKEAYYMIYSAKGPEDIGLRLCLAVAEQPEGPFHDLYTPLFDRGFSCIDGHLFVDEGRVYLYYEMVGSVGTHYNGKGYLWGMIFGSELSDDLSSLIGGEPKLCLYPTQDWENPGSMFARSTEGMTVFKIDTTYYMTYSANHYADPQYGVGFASATEPLGLWTKFEDNPILTQDLTKGVSGPGHNAVLLDPEGAEHYIIYHTHADPENPSHKRVLNLDRFEINDGVIQILGPTRSPSPIPFSH